MYVNEVMTTSVVSCKPHTALHAVAGMMWNADCGAVPVVDDAGKPIGIVTDRDIAMAAMLNHKPLWDLQAFTVMQAQHLHTCQPANTIESCLDTMEKNGVRRLPVVDDEGKLVGMLSLSDALALTKTDSRRKTPRVNVQQVVDMLRKVSTRNLVPMSPVQPW